MSWSTTIKSPNYPNKYSNSGSRTWLISAPIPGSTIDIEFDEFIVRQLKIKSSSYIDCYKYIP